MDTGTMVGSGWMWDRMDKGTMVGTVVDVGPIVRIGWMWG